MGLTRRRDAAALQDEEIIRIVREHQNKGVVNDFGIRQMQANLRCNNLYISRNDTMYALRTVDPEDPEGVERRYKKKNRTRKNFTVPGPN